MSYLHFHIYYLNFHVSDLNFHIYYTKTTLKHPPTVVLSPT